MSDRKAEILVVDDHAYVRDSLAMLLSRAGHAVRTAGTAEEALSDVASRPADVVVTDLELPGISGLELVQRLAREAPGLPAIVLTAHASVGSAVACIKAGAFEYLEKPADPEALSLAVGRAIAWSRTLSELERLKLAAGERDDLPAGESAEWRKVMTLVDAAAGVDATVLVLGESGVGKEIVAREVHRRSGRAAGPFVTVNCAAIAGELFESEFFGHRKGAFTGATADSEGRFRLAHGGTLFLDEVATLPVASQAKLLRVLQDGTFERVGDPRTVHVDVRVIAATNADLDAGAASGAFRQDLLYRLDVVRILVPPLRSRRDDIPVLAARLLPKLARRANPRVASIAPETLQMLCAYDWPGNVRELQNVLERALILEKGASLGPANLPFAELARRGATAAPGSVVLDLREATSRAERAALVEALRVSNGVRREAARLLGVDPRNLAYYLNKHGLKSEKTPEG